MWLTTDAKTLDELEMTALRCEAAIAQIRALQLQTLRALDAGGVAALDGARTMAEWISARLDVTKDTAMTLVRAARRVPDHPDLERELAAGAVSFDRAEATLALAATGATKEALADSRGLDLTGVARLTSRHRRLTEDQERLTFRDRYVAIQPSLDESRWRFHGRLAGYEGAVVAQALTERGDALHSDPHHRGSRGQRAADALYSMALDTLEPPEPLIAEDSSTAGDPDADDLPPPTFGRSRVPLVSVFVDAELAAASGGEAGVALAAGPRLGPAVLARLLCEGKVEINTTGATPLAVAPTSAVIPPRLRRQVLHRDGGCVIDGCSSRYRLEPHHVIPASAGGPTTAGNLETACWFHHHVVIHGRGMRIDPDSPPGRRRLLPPHPT